MNEWQFLGLEPTTEKKAIKRAYAKAIKKIDPSIEAELFQKTREVYEYLLEHGIHNIAEEEPIEHEPTIDAEANCKNTDIELTTNHSVEDAQEPASVELNHSIVEQPNTNSAQTLPEDNFGSNAEASLTSTYELVEEFITKLDNLYSLPNEQPLESWIQLLEQDEYQYFDVVEQLRIRVFGFFVEKISHHYETGNQPEKLKLKLLKERLSKAFFAAIPFYAEYFDWKHTELILANYFEHEQMNLVGQFYLDKPQPLEIGNKQKKSGLGNYFFWFILIFVLVKALGSIEDKRNNKLENNAQTSFSEILKNKSNLNLCDNYRLISNDEVAQRCLNSLQIGDNKQRFIIAFYWLQQYKNNLESFNAENNYFDRAVLVLNQAAENDYVPAINLLSGIYLGTYYQHNDIEQGINWLNVGERLNDPKSNLALAASHYFGIWSEKNTEKASLYYNAVSEESVDNNANLSFILAASYWLELKSLGLEGQSSTAKSKAKQLFEQSHNNAAPEYINNAAWFFATSTGEDFDPILALNLAREFQPEFRNSKDWRYINTLAAAYAARNNFESAIEYENKAIELLNSENAGLTESERKEANQQLQGNLSLFNRRKRIEIASTGQEIEAMFMRSFRELMRFNLDQLPK